MSRFVRVVWAALASAALAFSNVQADTAIVPDAAAAVVAADKIAPYLPRFGRQRPVVAVLGENSNTVLTDFVVPYGVLAQSGVADVVSIGTTAGPLQLRPALRIVPDETMASFDQRFPQGADYVVVPAIGKRGYGPEGAWLTAQVAKGATIVSICDGVQVVADAGLLKGRRATGHWASYANRVAAHPDTQWVTNARYVVDGRFVSSAGISAALPTALALVEAIGGTERAKAFAVTLGVDNWSTQHDSDAFKLGFGIKMTHWVNMNLHSTQTIGIPVAAGVDEIDLALRAESWSRTMRSEAVTVAAVDGPIKTRGGLTLLPDNAAGRGAVPDLTLPAEDGVKGGQAIDAALAEIESRYGAGTARMVALAFEYPWKGL